MNRAKVKIAVRDDSHAEFRIRAYNFAIFEKYTDSL